MNVSFKRVRCIGLKRYRELLMLHAEPRALQGRGFVVANEQAYRRIIASRLKLH